VADDDDAIAVALSVEVVRRRGVRPGSWAVPSTVSVNVVRSELLVVVVVCCTTVAGGAVVSGSLTHSPLSLQVNLPEPVSNTRCQLMCKCALTSTVHHNCTQSRNQNEVSCGEDSSLFCV
jgi:hypothetical protein